jgi:hypothetical protein
MSVGVGAGVGVGVDIGCERKCGCLGGCGWVACREWCVCVHVYISALYVLIVCVMCALCVYVLAIYSALMRLLFQKACGPVMAYSHSLYGCQQKDRIKNYACRVDPSGEWSQP